MGKAGDSTKTRQRTEAQVSNPPMYRVLLHNDDYTPMEYVVSVLIRFFRKSPTEAEHIMLTVHHKGVAECGQYPFEIAETKVSHVHQDARAEGHPLRASLEEI